MSEPAAAATDAAPAPNYRRVRTAEAARLLDQLGAPRSRSSLEKDRMYPPGQRGPKFTRDQRGQCWYLVTDLEAWAAQQRATLSPDNPPPPPVARRAAAASVGR